MNRNTNQKLTRSIQRTFALLLAALMLNVGAFADNADERALREQYGDEWEKVAALQPGDSYISGDTMYICHEETYVDWTRVRSEKDLDPSSWGAEERLLLMTDTSGWYLYVGNDYAYSNRELDNRSDHTVLVPDTVETTRRILSGVTRDTSGNNTAEYVDELVYPELYEFYKENPSRYPYPDTFQTVGTMNAPYIRYAGLDTVNGNHRKFKIILPKEDGSMSSAGLSYRTIGEWVSALDWTSPRIDVKPVGECTGYTFIMKDEKIRIFQEIDNEDDMLLKPTTGNMLYAKDYENLEELMKTSSGLVLYLGEKTVGKRIEAISLDLEDAEQNPEALENVYGGAIEFYHWEKITKSSQLPTDSGTYRALLVWDDMYFLQGDYFRKKGDGMALYVNEEKKGNVVRSNVAETPEIDLSQNEFYTMGGLGTPYMKFSHRDEDNENCPSYRFQLAGVDDQPSRKWLCDGDNVLDLCLEGAGDGRNGGMAAGIIVGKEGDPGNDASPGKVKLFYNEGGGGTDTGFKHIGNIFYGDNGSKWENIDEFTMYIGRPVVYPAVRQNYVVGEDQFAHISQNGAMFKNVTITVAKGGVLSIESWFMNNGRIVVDGGTLIVQNASNPLGDEEADDTEDSVMLPFADIHPTVSGSLELRNGGELIVMENTRAAFSNITATSGSSILNNGMLLAETLSLQESTLENRKGMSMFVGYDFREIQAFRNGEVGNVISDLASRLNSATSCITVGTKSSIFNDGSIRYSTARTPEDDNDWKLGGGSYTQVRGKQSRYMLKN